MNTLLGDAAREAQTLGHEYIGTEHLLLALLAAKESCGATALRDLGGDLKVAANRVRTVIHAGSRHLIGSSSALLLFTSRAKKVLNLAADDGRALYHPATPGAIAFLEAQQRD